MLGAIYPGSSYPGGLGPFDTSSVFDYQGSLDVGGVELESRSRHGREKVRAVPTFLPEASPGAFKLPAWIGPSTFESDTFLVVPAVSLSAETEFVENGDDDELLAMFAVAYGDGGIYAEI
jgi:hypothetical protein